MVDLAQPLELVVQEDRVRDHELARVLGRLVEEVPLRADARGDAHHDLLADRVDRRVRHLREELLEVRVEERLAVGEHRQWQVVAHRADGLLGVPRERREDDLHVLLRVAEGELEAAERLLDARLGLTGRQVGEPDDLLLVPARVRPLGRELLLHLGVVDDPALGEVDEEELARAETTLAEDVGGRHVEDSRLGGEHDPAVARLEPAARTKAVPVERRADHAAVREGERGRPVPRLGEAAVVGVEPGDLGRDVVAALVGLGNHHRDRVRERATGEHEQLEDVVEGRRVGAARPDDREHLLEVVRRRAREASCDSRARIQLTFPWSVLISPLWASIRYGCASSQLGKVFVE